MAITSAPGKVILFGEHAVSYNKSAIAGAISARTKAEFRDRMQCNEIIFKDYAPKIETRKEIDNIILGNFDQNYENAIQMIKANSNLENVFQEWHDPFVLLTAKFEDDNKGYFFPDNYLISVTNKIAKGCGSGSAITATVVASMYKHFKTRWDRRIVETYVSFLDNIFHANHNSQIDAKTVVYGNFQIKTKHGDFDYFRLKENFPILIVDSGVSAKTCVQTKKLEDLIAKEDKAMSIIDEIGLIAEQGIREIRKRDIIYAGELMYENHDLLKKLDLSCPELDRIVEIARECRAYGAKLTGAGGGGSAIIIADNLEIVQSKLAIKGFKSRIRYVGVAGIRDEVK